MSIAYGQMDSLINKCIFILANEDPQYVGGYQYLSRNMKTNLLRILTKRGKVGQEALEALLHPEVYKLDFSSCNISDRQLSLVRTCKWLVELNLTSMKGTRPEISSEGLISLFPHIPYLQRIALTRCISVDDQCVISLANNCRNLVHLSLCGCPLITDLSLANLGQKCERLRAIDLSGTLIADQGVFQLVQGQSSSVLEEMMINKCVKITDEAIEAIVSLCPQINILTFSGCPKITEQSRIMIQELQNRRGAQLRQVTWTIY